MSKSNLPTMIPFLQNVKEFHQLFNHPIAPSPTNIPIDRQDLRYHLIKEENEEFLEGLEKNNLVEIADALGDTLYVLGGAIIEHGLQDAMPEIFAEIHKSNMSKACRTLEEVQKTVAKYEADGIEVYSKNKRTNNSNVVFLIYRKSDNKILKNINYKPANLLPIIKKYIAIHTNPVTPDKAFKNKQQ